MEEPISVIFVTPYPGMEREVEEVFRQFDRQALRYRILSMTPDQEPQISQLNSDVVIARGFSAAFFRQEKIPVVELNTTGYDLILAVQKCIRSYGSTHMALLGTETMLYNTLQFSSLFPGVQVDCYRAETRDHTEECIQSALEHGATALIGGRSTCEAAAQLNVPCVMIENSRESILKSVDMAVQLVRATRAERAEADRVAKIMDYSFGGILSTDREGIVSDINRKACDIFGMERRAVLGQHISRLIPGLKVEQVIQRGEKLLDELCRVGSEMVLFNCVPIEGEKSNSGAVITCQQVREVQKSEAKIRKQMLQRGFVAHYYFSDIICQDAVMKEIVNRATRYSSNRANVLLYGETGVGKELFAQSIHNASPRCDGPFVAINCAALPEQLLESELFGYVEGAFTGAAKGGKIGLFEAAHRGTIFLDEIGDLSLKLQGRLLRVLQEKEIVRLGDDHVIPIDVRVISATNKDLRQEVAKGNFRTDLMYRLDVLKLEIPPLRERRGDIIPLLEHFLQEYRRQEGRPCFEAFAPEAAELLQENGWDGNVRQLRNVAQRLCILCEGEVVTQDAVREALELGRGGSKVKEAGEEQERLRILEALRQNQFKRSRAAAQLNMDRSTLWRKMKKYGLDRP